MGRLFTPCYGAAVENQLPPRVLEAPAGRLPCSLVQPKYPGNMAAAVEAYCVKCKAKRNMKDPKENTMANGRKAMKGTCPTCGTGMFKIMGKA